MMRLMAKLDLYLNRIADDRPPEKQDRACRQAAQLSGAAAYAEFRLDGAKPLFGVGISPNIVTASLRAVTSAVNRALRAPDTT